MLWYQWGIVCQQSNVQTVLLNFSLYYEWFNFYSPVLFSLHPTSLSKWKSQLIILTCPAMIQQSPSGRLQVAVRSTLGDFPCLCCRADHPWVTVQRPDRERWISVRLPVGFFPPITPQLPTGRRAEAGRRPGGVLWDAGRWVNLRDIGRSSGKI